MYKTSQKNILSSTLQICLSFKCIFWGPKLFCQPFLRTNKHKSVVLMTNDSGAAAEPQWLAGATISPLALSVVSHPFELTQMQRHPFKDTDVMCVLQTAEAMSLYDYMAASGWMERWEWVKPPRCPFNLNQWIPSYRLCSHRAWRLERKTAVVHSLVASSFVSFYFFDLPVFNPVESHCLYVHLSYPPSLFPQFFYVCLLFCAIISQAPSKGKSA